MSRIIWMAPQDKKNLPRKNEWMYYLLLKECIINISYNTKKTFALIIFEITQIYKIHIIYRIL